MKINDIHIKMFRAGSGDCILLEFVGIRRIVTKKLCGWRVNVICKGFFIMEEDIFGHKSL